MENDKNVTNDSSLGLKFGYNKKHNYLTNLSNFLIRYGGGVYKIDHLNKLILTDHRDTSIYDKWLTALNITLDIEGTFQQKELTSGPLVIISNHPFGVLEGLILGGIAKKHGLNFKIMANYLLSSVADQIKQDIIGIDPYADMVSIKRNVTPLKQAFNWLKNGNAMILFPSGDVANFTISKMKIIEAPWSLSVGRLIRKTEANILPIYFDGRNSILFYLLKSIHLKLGTFRLLHELFNKAGTVIKLRVGDVIRYNELEERVTQQNLTEFLRQKTINLGEFFRNSSQE